MRRVPLPPQKFDAAAFFQGTQWSQHWEIFSGVFTPGSVSVEKQLSDFEMPDDLTGKRVLDAHPGNGCLAFECERRNALEVVAVGPEDPEASGFNRLGALLKSTRTRFVRGSVYDLDPAKIGYFDLIFYCGALYQQRYPLLAMDNLRRVAIDSVFLETVLLEDQTLEENRKLPKSIGKLSRFPLWLLFSGPNETAVLQAFRSAGFEATRLHSDGNRGSFKATVLPGMPDFLSDKTPEGLHYREVMAPVLNHRSLRVRVDEWLEEWSPPVLKNHWSKIKGLLRQKLTGSLMREEFQSKDWQRMVHSRTGPPSCGKSDRTLP